MDRNVLLTFFIIISLSKPNTGTNDKQCSSADHKSCRGADGTDTGIDESILTSTQQLINKINFFRIY